MGFARKDCGGPSSTLRKGGKSMVKHNIVFVICFKLVLTEGRLTKSGVGLKTLLHGKGASVLEVDSDPNRLSP